MNNSSPNDASSICFGWDRATDEHSFRAFVQCFSRPELLAVLTPRLTDAELTGLVDHLSGLMKKHLSEREYHSLFFGQHTPRPGPGRIESDPDQ
jgi:hypothetical protein